MEDYLLKENIKNTPPLGNSSRDPDVFVSPLLVPQPPQEDFSPEVETALSEDYLDDLKEELDYDDDLDTESLKDSLSDLPDKPSFPVFLFMFAVIVDVAQILATFTVIFAIFTPILGILFGIVSFFYFFGKINFVQKFITRKLLNRFLLTFFVEFIPGLNVIPTATIFTFLAYKSQSKIISAYLKAADALGKAEGL